MKKDIINSIKIIILGALFSASSALAWTAPDFAPSSPYAGDTLPPIHQGLQNQTKPGPLGVGTLIVDGLTNFNGRVEILAAQSLPSGGGGGPQSGFLQKFLNKLPKFSFTKTAYAGHITYDAPTNLTATIDQQSWLVELNWVNNTNVEPSYTIERKTGSGSFQVIDTISASATYYEDANLPGPGTYTYRVASSGAHAPSPLIWSNLKLVTLFAATCQDTAALNYNGALPCTYPPKSDLYVSGKVVVGSVSFTPTEKVDVQWLAISSLMVNQGQDRRVCADANGKLVFCPQGTTSYYQSYCPSSTPCSWTVPDGVFKVTFQTAAGGQVVGYPTSPINVVPGNVLSIITGPTTATLVQLNW